MLLFAATPGLVARFGLPGWGKRRRLPRCYHQAGFIHRCYGKKWCRHCKRSAAPRTLVMDHAGSSWDYAFQRGIFALMQHKPLRLQCNRQLGLT